MKRRFLIIAMAMVAILGSHSVQGQTTSFSYQGTLNLGGTPANGSFDFEFRLYDALSGGGQIGTTNSFNAVGVRNGQFTVTLSFGANAFPGEARWIQISVRQAGGGAYTILLPRQSVTATPYAITSFKAVSLTGTLAIAGGGTGATDAAAARSNLGAAASGANGDITSLSGLTAPLSVVQGGTGAASANSARASIGAAASGANSDITALTGLKTPLGIEQGGTGGATVTYARANIGAAQSGANVDITSISGLTTPLSVAQGGTGAVSVSAARVSLGVAGSGANSDITALKGLTTPLEIGQGGTGATTAISARASINAAGSGANVDITSISGLITPLSVAQGGTGASSVNGARVGIGAAGSGANSDITALMGLTTPLGVEQGGTGATTAGAARENIGAASSGMNSDITALTALTTPLAISQGGTGTSVNPSTAGQYLRSTAAGIWSVSPIAKSDLPALNSSYVDLVSNQQIGGNKSFLGVLSGDGSGLTSVKGTFNWELVSSPTLNANNNTGYIVTNTSPVTITLSDSPAIGDRIRITGAGSGGWRILSNNEKSLFGFSNKIVWNPTLWPANWMSLAITSAKNIIAVGRGTKIPGNLSSGPEYKTWTSVSTSRNANIAVATASFDFVFISEDNGQGWNPVQQLGWGTWKASCISGDGINIGVARPNQPIYISNNAGGSWTPRGGSQPWETLAMSSDGKTIAAAGYNTQIYVSKDYGVSWSQKGPIKFWLSIASSSDGSIMAAVANIDTIYISNDYGETWTPRENIRRWYSVAISDNGKRIVAGAGDSNIYLSDDYGETWKAEATINEWSAVAISPNGSIIAAAAIGGQVYVTSDLDNLQYLLRGAQGSSVELQYIGSNKYLIISQIGSVYTN
jgi:hypothetical protein